MSAKNTKRTVGLLVVVAFLAGLAILNGCKQSEEEQAAPNEAERAGAKGTMDAEELVAVASKEIQQKTCPVMGSPINEDIYVEHKGKKVYFCCQSCVEAFKKEPEKYLAKLPQFKN